MDGMKMVLLGAEILTVLSAVFVAFHPSILKASIALLFSFLGVAMMFIYAGADFIAGVQVVVYVGGVTILVLFAIMLTQWLHELSLNEVRKKFLLPLIVLAAGFVPFLGRALRELVLIVSKAPPAKLAEFSNQPKTTLIGQSLLTQYLLPFEAVTILLLGALVGAVWLARPAK